MPSNNVYGTLANGDSVDLTEGMVVRIAATRTAVRAQADSAGHVQGLAGVVIAGSAAPGAPSVSVALTAFGQRVLCDVGLTLAAGDTLYVSAVTAGKATNAAPGIPVAIGTVEDASTYGADSHVVATVDIAALSGGSAVTFAAPPDIGPNETVAGVAATVNRSDAVPGQKIQATWSITHWRWYAVDGTNGNDANVGFSDTSSADAGTKAKKTIAGLTPIFPKVGAGRRVAIVINAGSYSENFSDLLAGVEGYEAGSPLIVGTVTNTTAGSVAFAGDANDRIMAGGVTATGMFAAGYNPVSPFSTSTIKCLQVGSGAPAFPAEFAIPLGYRLRFDSNTATVALRNVAIQIIGVPASDTLTISSVQPVLPATPTGADVFYLEQPGVVLTGTSFIGVVGQKINTTVDATAVLYPVMQLVGINGAFRLYRIGVRFAFYVGTGFIAESGSQSSATYRDETGAARQVGMQMKGSVSSVGFQGMNALNGNDTIIGGSSLASFQGSGKFEWANGSQCNGMTLFHVTGPVDNPANQPDSLLGARVVNQQPTTRITGATLGATRTAGLNMMQSEVTLGRIAITGCGANPAIVFQGRCVVAVSDQLTGSTGNNDVGLDLVGSCDSRVLIYSLPTVTGGLGNVRLSNGTIVSWAVAAAGIVDPAGNILMGTTTSPLKHTAVAAGGVTVTINNAPNGSPAAPVRYASIPDGAGGFFTFPSLT